MGLGEPFPWLFIDPETLLEQAAAHGFHCDILVRGEHYDYLACLTRRSTPPSTNLQSDLRSIRIRIYINHREWIMNE